MKIKPICGIPAAQEDLSKSLNRTYSLSSLLKREIGKCYPVMSEYGQNDS